MAGDFVSDFAKCAKGPIDATKFAMGQSRKAAEFVVDHGECVPMVVGGDALLYGLSGAFVGLQNAGTLPQGAQACVDATLGVASKPVASVLYNAPGISTLIPAEGKTMLLNIAQGQSEATLYQVPGVGLVMEHVSCACAVASSGVDIHELKEQAGNVVDAVEGCSGMGKKLLSGAYAAATSAGEAVAGAAQAAYGAAKDAVNAVGCTLGLGGCSKKGPPFFCTGYNILRALGKDREFITHIFPDIFPQSYVQNESTACENQWLAMIEAQKKKAAEAKEAARLAEENEKAAKLGAANGLGYAFRWVPKCLDETCKTSISKFADVYTKDIQDAETITIYGSFMAAKHALDKKYGSLAEVAVGLSKDRRDKALRADAGAPPGDRLQAFGCHLFLGRAGQSLCKKQDGFDVCRGYVQKGVWKSCGLTGRAGFYSAGAALGEVLREAGCIPSDAVQQARGGGRLMLARRYGRNSENISAQCLSPSARHNCDFYKSGQSAVDCHGPDVVTFDRQRIRAMSARRPVLPALTETPRAPIEVAPPPPAFSPVQRFDTRVQRPQVSTICAFDAGPRAGQQQDYAPMAPIPVGSPCQDARGSSGRVVAP